MSEPLKPERLRKREILGLIHRQLKRLGNPDEPENVQQIIEDRILVMSIIETSKLSPEGIALLSRFLVQLNLRLATAVRTEQKNDSFAAYRNHTNGISSADPEEAGNAVMEAEMVKVRLAETAVHQTAEAEAIILGMAKRKS